MSEHTPSPWEFRRAKHPVDGQFDYAISSAANPGCIAECFGRVGQDRVENAAANAAFIVRAVNAYQAIKDALGTDEDDEALVEVARNAHQAEQELAALTKARGQ